MSDINVFRYQEDKICPKYVSVYKSFPIFDLKILKEAKTQKGPYIITGILKNTLFNLSYRNTLYIKYWAPNPPTYNIGFSGTCLPYPNEEVAYENTPNKGVVPVIDGKFSINIMYPNSYYSDLGTVLNPPLIKIKICDMDKRPVSQIQTVYLSDNVPFRTLSMPNQWYDKGALFYDNDKLPIRGQYEILMSKRYNSKVPSNYWGLAPPC